MRSGEAIVYSRKSERAHQSPSVEVSTLLPVASSYRVATAPSRRCPSFMAAFSAGRSTKPSFLHQYMYGVS